MIIFGIWQRLAYIKHRYGLFLVWQVKDLPCDTPTCDGWSLRSCPLCLWTSNPTDAPRPQSLQTQFSEHIKCDTNDRIDTSNACNASDWFYIVIFWEVVSLVYSHNAMCLRLQRFDGVFTNGQTAEKTFFFFRYGLRSLRVSYKLSDRPARAEPHSEQNSPDRRTWEGTYQLLRSTDAPEQMRSLILISFYWTRGPNHRLTAVSWCLDWCDSDCYRCQLNTCLCCCCCWCWCWCWCKWRQFVDSSQLGKYLTKFFRSFVTVGNSLVKA